jgi:hypothetical protein
MEDSKTQSKFKFPTEVVKLPSKGLLYPEGHPLSSGEVEMKYMTAKEEDILTNLNYIKQGIVIDKLLQSLLVTKFDWDDLLVGDKNAIMVAARVLGYGKDYPFMYDGEEILVDLSELPSVELDENQVTRGVNEFEYTLPSSGNKITFKYLTGKDEKAIDAEIKGMKRINKNTSADISTRLKHQIISVEGETDKKTVRDFVDNYMLAKDSSAFRSHIKATQPDIKMTFIHDGANGEEEVTIPMQVQFFWPDARV